MKFFLLIISIALNFSCGSDSDRPENIFKVRGLGMSAIPLVSVPSTSSDPKTVDLTIFVALPNGDTVTVEKYTDQATNSAILLDSSQYDVVAGSENTKVYNKVTVMSFHAIAKIPLSSQIPPTGARIRIGFLIKGKSNTERFTGDFLVVAPSNTSLLAWKAPEIAIQEPTLGQNLSANNTANVKANATNFNNENLQVGWFASSGEITNRRSINTYWKTPKAGLETLIVTLRGKQSLGFAMKVLDLKTE